MLLLLIRVSIKVRLQSILRHHLAGFSLFKMAEYLLSCCAGMCVYNVHPPLCVAAACHPLPTYFRPDTYQSSSLRVNSMWPRTGTPLSAKDQQPDGANRLKSQQVRILQKRAKSICGGEQGSKQWSLYLCMSLERAANRTRGGRKENLPEISLSSICESTRWTLGSTD